MVPPLSFHASMKPACPDRLAKRAGAVSVDVADDRFTSGAGLKTQVLP
jgi:hypothetical protein